MNGKLTITKFNKKDEPVLQEFSSRNYEFWEKQFDFQDVLDLGSGVKIVSEIGGRPNDRRLIIKFLNLYGGEEDDDITTDHRTLALEFDQDSALKLMQTITAAYVKFCSGK